MSFSPIFVLGAPKSGTTLVQSLLDNHDQIVNIPFELRLFQHAGYPSLVAEHRGKSDLSNYKKSTVDECLSYLLHHKELNQSVRNISVDSGPVKDALRSIDTTGITTCEELFRAIFDALYNRLGNHKTRYVMEKTPLQEEFLPELQSFFPAARFIHIVRNPYAQAVTLRKRVLNAGSKYPYLKRSVVDIICLSAYSLMRNRRIARRHLIVRYEDLINDPANIMGRVAHFLDIPYGKTLVEPTIGGEPWGGNSMYKDSIFSGIDSRSIGRWRSEINPLEIEFINKYLRAFVEEFYPPAFIGDNHRRWWPIRKEGLKTYLGNRIALKQ